MAVYENYNDENMKKWYDTFLQSDESIKVALYGVYSNVGTFISNGAFPGYMAITNKSRILCHNNDIRGAHDYRFLLSDIKKVKTKRGLIGNLIVYITFTNGKKKYKLKFNTPKRMQEKLFKQHENNVNALEVLLNIGSVDEHSLDISNNAKINTLEENTMKPLYDEIIQLGDMVEEKGIDFVKSKAPIELEEIELWEKSNDCQLPREYKELLLLTDGIKYSMTSLNSLSQIKKDVLEFKGYYVIGDYIGDGSLLLCDDKGNIYAGEHEKGVKKVDFKEFINEWLIDMIKEDLQ